MRQRKSNAVIRCAAIAVAVVVMLLVVGRVGYWQTHYYRTGIVVSVEDGIVAVEDTTGNVWEVEADGYAEGEQVRMLMNTQGTDDAITDDTVVSMD